MKKIMLSAALAGLLLAGVPAVAHSTPAQSSQSEQQTPKDTKMVSGTITSIGNNGTSFALEVTEGKDKQTMQFVLDKNAKVQGSVKVGTPVMVEYAVQQNQNLALTVTAQG